MIRDSRQKIKAVRYCVARGLVPCLEVVVHFLADISESPCDLTDIDVLGIRPGADTPTVRIIFDCKTQKKMSAINRAFWAKGLMSFSQSSEAFVILSRPAIEAHRLAGNSFGVRLFSEDLFETFAASASADYLVVNSYIEEIDSWAKLENSRRNYPALNDLLSYLNSTAPLQVSGNRGIRSLMSRVRRDAGELDPSKDVHRAIFKLALAQFSIFVNELVRDFNNIFDPLADRVQFENTLRYHLWGGKENYDLRQRLNAAMKNARGVAEPEPFEFPAWEHFVEYFRQCLDSPLSVSATCLPIKDMAFRALTVPVEDIDRRLSARLRINNRVRQFSLAAASYFIEASGLPREFGESFKSAMNSLVDGTSAVS